MANDIPENIRNAATALAQAIQEHAVDGSEAISLAILAAEKRGEEREREACAQVAQDEANRTRARMDPKLLDRMIHVDSAWGMCTDTSGIIRDAIRKRGA